jgi:predicted peptidase
MKTANQRSPLEARRASVRVTFTYRYLLALPRGYAKSKTKRWPFVVFLHGRGERGNDLELVKRHGLPKLIAEGREFPFVTIAPHCPDDEWWNYPALEAFIDDAVKRYRCDPTRIYLTGLSMGGFATWALAQHRPSHYAAILPICGGGEVRQAAGLRDLSVWAFHGARDEVIPLERSQEMIAAIKAAGGKPRLTVYPKAGHDAWTKTYANEKIYSWLLAQRRSGPALSP